MYISLLILTHSPNAHGAPTAPFYGAYTPHYMYSNSYQSDSKNHATLQHLDVSVRIRNQVLQGSEVSRRQTHLEMSLSCLLERSDRFGSSFWMKSDHPHVELVTQSDGYVDSWGVDADLNKDMCGDVATRFTFTLVRKPSVYMVSSAKTGSCLSMKRSNWFGGDSSIVPLPKQECNPARNPSLLWSIRPLNATTLLALQSQFPQSTMFLDVADVAGSAYWIQPAKGNKNKVDSQTQLRHEENDDGWYVGVKLEENGDKSLGLVKRPE
ncbi:hypothetical protein HK096_001925, partial [Nowakowskiella sp. JEL0078]